MKNTGKAYIYIDGVIVCMVSRLIGCLVYVSRPWNKVPSYKCVLPCHSNFDLRID